MYENFEGSRMLRDPEILFVVFCSRKENGPFGILLHKMLEVGEGETNASKKQNAGDAKRESCKGIIIVSIILYCHLHMVSHFGREEPAVNSTFFQPPRADISTKMSETAVLFFRQEKYHRPNSRNRDDCWISHEFLQSPDKEDT